MGCVPHSSSKKPEIIPITSEEQSEIFGEEKVGDIRINIGLLVKGIKADPKKYYDDNSILGEGAFGKVMKVSHKISKVERAMK